MRKYLVILLIFALLAPLPVLAQTADTSFLLAKIQLLKLQIELLKAQISLLLSRFQSAAPAAANCAQLNVSWERVSGADSYRLYRNDVVVYEGRERSFTDSGLVLGKKYSYVVYGLRQGVQGEPSEAKEITAPNVCPPKTPRLSFRAEPCGGTITLSWNRSSTASAYQVFRQNREIYTGSLATFADAKLTPNAVYEYKIRAGNRGGWSDFSVPVSFQASNVCAPSELKVSSVVSEEGVREGFLLAQMQRSPGDNTKIRLGAEHPSINRSVMAFKLEAQASDITITRIDLFFDFPVWLYLEKIGIRAGGAVAEEEISQESFTRRGDIYQFRLDGFSKVVKEDRSLTFSVMVDAKASTAGNLPRNITVFLENNSVRGVDEAGISQLAPVSGGGKGNVFSRTFRVETP